MLFHRSQVAKRILGQSARSAGLVGDEMVRATAHPQSASERVGTTGTPLIVVKPLHSYQHPVDG